MVIRDKLEKNASSEAAKRASKTRISDRKAARVGDSRAVTVECARVEYSARAPNGPAVPPSEHPAMATETGKYDLLYIST